MHESTQEVAGVCSAAPSSSSRCGRRPKAVPVLISECQIGRLDKLMEDLRVHPGAVNARDRDGAATALRLKRSHTTGDLNVALA